MKDFISRFGDETVGQDLIEYALLTALLVLAVTGVLTVLASRINLVFTSVETAFP